MTYKNLPVETSEAILTVADVASLPTDGVEEGAIRYVQDVDALYTYDGSSWGTGASGIMGPGASTDTAIARWNGTGGTALQDSGVLIDASDNITGVNDLTVGGATTLSALTATTVPYLDGSKALTSSAVTPTELGYLSGVTSALQTQLSGKEPTITGAATTITSSDLTVSRALESDGSGKVAVSTVTSTELSYVSGVTSAIQTQINGKEATITGAATTITGSDLTASRVLESDVSGKVAASATTSTELGYLSGVTSAIQTQMDAKLDDFTSTNDDRLVRTNGTSGDAVQESAATLTDAGALSGLTQLDVDNLRIDGNTLSSTTGDVNLSAGANSILATGATLQLRGGMELALFDDDNSQSIVVSRPANITTNRAPEIPDDTGDFMLTSATQTVTGKTMDADNNTFSNFAHGAEVDNPSSGVHGVTGSIVGTIDSQAISNKAISGSDINLGGASDTSKLVVSKDTTSSLNGLTREEASIYYDTTLDRPVYDNGTAIVLFGERNRIQRKTLGASGDITTNTDFLEFTGLTVGKTYRATGMLLAELISSDSVAFVRFRQGTTNESEKITLVNPTGAQFNLTYAFNYTFTATETSFKLRTESLDTGSIINADPGGNRSTWMTLEELNNSDVTTAWGSGDL